MHDLMADNCSQCLWRSCVMFHIDKDNLMIIVADNGERVIGLIILSQGSHVLKKQPDIMAEHKRDRISGSSLLQISHCLDQRLISGTAKVVRRKVGICRRCD